MAELKTQPTKKSVKRFLESVKDEEKRKASFMLLDLFEKVTKKPPVMWGDSIVGFGSYHYTYKSGREADWLLTGFSPRKTSLTIYIMNGFKNYEDLLGVIGKHTHSASCLYVKKIEDIDLAVLKKLIRRSLADMKKLYPTQ